jgi:hypothetical protein
LERLRLATPEEIEALKDKLGDIDASTQPIALTTQAGSPVAIIRAAVEVDPVIFPENFPDRLKAVFVRDVETHLAAKGVPYYYFNVAADDEKWQSVIKTWGAQAVSPVPEIRFKKVL